MLIIMIITCHMYTRYYIASIVTLIYITSISGVWSLIDRVVNSSNENFMIFSTVSGISF